MARDWNEYEAKIREEIERKVAHATERAERKADRMRARADRGAQRAHERAEWYAEKVREKVDRDADRAKEGYSNWADDFGLKFGRLGGCQSGKGEHDSEILIGIAILGLGAALLFSNMGIFDWRDISRFWPILLVAAGIMRLKRASFPSARGFAILLIVAGGILLFGTFGLFRISWNLFWPAILIVVGLQHLLRNFDPPKASKPADAAPKDAAPKAAAPPASQHGPETPTSGPRPMNSTEAPRYAGAAAPPPPPGPGPSATSEPDVHLHEYCIFTGGKRRITTNNFRGGEIVAVFGGVEVDLRGSQLGADEVVVDITAAFGGCNIKVPTNWYVEMRGVAAFGGYNNKTIPPRISPGQRFQKLIVTGSAAFGGVVIEN